LVCLPGLLLAAGLVAPVTAQQLDPQAPSSYFDVMPVHADDQPVHALLDEMRLYCTRIEKRCKPGTTLLRRLFQGSYRDDLPDFIVEIARDEATGLLKAHQPVLMFERRNTPYLMGVEQVGAVLFSPEPLPMTARLTTIQERDVNPFAGMMGVFGVAAGEKAPVSERAVQSEKITWRRLSAEGDGNGLYIGTASLPMQSEAVSRLTLIPGTPDDSDTTEAEDYATDFQSITGHLSNSRASYAAFSIGLGMTFGTADTGLADQGDPLFNAYALAKFYLPNQRPRLEVAPDRTRLFRRSVGLVVGTNVTNDAFREILLGLSIGHVIGKAGLIVAANALDAGMGQSDREIRLLVGVDYTF
jgi:hypothetical protein